MQGAINGHEFDAVLEPDGLRGHWMQIPPGLQRAADVSAGDVVTLVIEVAGDWPEPDVPPDLAAALAAAPQNIRDVWHDITPMARWEWVRWVNATANPSNASAAGRGEHLQDGHGKRRPCCFDLSSCTDPALSKNGKLRTSG